MLPVPLWYFVKDAGTLGDTREQYSIISIPKVTLFDFLPP